MSDVIVFGSMPASTKAAFRAARKLMRVDENMSNEDALAKGIIPPELIDLLMQMLQDWLQGCLSSQNRTFLFKRIRSYVEETREFNRIGDNVRLNGTINAWLNRMGYPRRSGDVVAIRKAVVEAAAEMKEEEFDQLQTEIMFLVI